MGPWILRRSTLLSVFWIKKTLMIRNDENHLFLYADPQFYEEVPHYFESAENYLYRAIEVS